MFIISHLHIHVCHLYISHGFNDVLNTTRAGHFIDHMRSVNILFFLEVNIKSFVLFIFAMRMDNDNTVLGELYW